MANVRVHDNGAAYMVTVDGLIVSAHNSLGAAWERIAWMYAVASQEFTVGAKEVPAKEWREAGIRSGYLPEDAGMKG